LFLAEQSDCREPGPCQASKVLSEGRSDALDWQKGHAQQISRICIKEILVLHTIANSNPYFNCTLKLKKISC